MWLRAGVGLSSGKSQAVAVAIGRLASHRPQFLGTAVSALDSGQLVGFGIGHLGDLLLTYGIGLESRLT